jgi:hypothetical protein
MRTFYDNHKKIREREMIKIFVVLKKTNYKNKISSQMTLHLRVDANM